MQVPLATARGAPCLLHSLLPTASASWPWPGRLRPSCTAAPALPACPCPGPSLDQLRRQPTRKVRVLGCTWCSNGPPGPRPNARTHAQGMPPPPLLGSGAQAATWALRWTCAETKDQKPEPAAAMVTPASWGVAFLEMPCGAFTPPPLARPPAPTWRPACCLRHRSRLSTQGPGRRQQWTSWGRSWRP
jgi:hypothetical protein